MNIEFNLKNITKQNSTTLLISDITFVIIQFSILRHFIPKLPPSLDIYTLEYSPRFVFSPKAPVSLESQEC